MPKRPRAALLKISISTRSRVTSSIFSAALIAASMLSPSASTESILALGCGAIDVVLLRNRQDVIHQPVERQAGGEVDEHEREHQGHDHHDTLLLWISGGPI